MTIRPVLAEESDARTRLAELGLTPEIIQEALLAGELHRRRCTRNHPPSYAGYGAWAETICRLGELKRPDNWVRRDPSNLSLIVSPDESVALAVATGDERTGRNGMPHPRTKYGKGPTVLTAVERNAEQLLLFDSARREKAKRPPLTWFLLVRRGRGEIRWEVSLPDAVDDEGYIVSWSHRIILEPISLEDSEEREPLEPTDEIDIEVPAREE